MFSKIGLCFKLALSLENQVKFFKQSFGFGKVSLFSGGVFQIFTLSNWLSVFFGKFRFWRNRFPKLAQSLWSMVLVKSGFHSSKLVSLATSFCTKSGFSNQLHFFGQGFGKFGLGF